MNRSLFARAFGLCALPLIAASTAHAATVTLSVGDGRLVEPPSGQKSLIFPVALSGVWSEDVRVSYATSEGPNSGTADATTLAQSGFDYSSRQGQITIPSGRTMGQIEIPILADNEVEKDETFALTLSNLQGFDNSGASVFLKRSLAKGTIVEPVKGVALGGVITSYEVNPSAYSSYDPNTGQYTDLFDTPAQPVLLSGVSVLVSGTNFSRTVTTDAQGRFTALVRPGKYSVQVQNFARRNFGSTFQTYTQPARTVTVSRDSRANNFFFYGVSGTVAYKVPNSSFLYPSYANIEVRPFGASPTSAPVASAISEYSDPIKLSRGYRFSIVGLPAGRYTLSIARVGD
jgi:hypothetical protein